MLAGVSPGAAFVFLSAGPATNTVTMGVVKKMLGTRTLTIYLATIIIGSVIFGFGLDYVLSGVDVKELVHMHEEASLIAMASSILLWAFVLYYMLKPYFSKKDISEKFVKNTQALRQLIQNAPFFEHYDDFKNHLIKKSGLHLQELESSLRLLLSGAESGPDISKIYKHIKNYLHEIIKH